jgi:TRAP-type C4-dicarboxylate transport system substrate-binding protein
MALDPKDQAAIEAVSEKYFSEVAMGLWDKQNESALKYAVEEKGMEVITLSRLNKINGLIWSNRFRITLSPK